MVNGGRQATPGDDSSLSEVSALSSDYRKIRQLAEIHTPYFLMYKISQIESHTYSLFSGCYTKKGIH